MEQILLQHYSLTIQKQKKLDGYASINYQVTTDTGHQYVSKVYTQPEDFVLAAEESRILNAIQHKIPVEVPITIPNISGELLSQNPDGSLTRLLPYIEGMFIAEVAHTPELLFSLGQAMGKVNQALAAEHSDSIQARRLFWDLQYAYLNEPKMAYITPAADQNLVWYFFDQYQYVVRPQLPYLRHGLIHGDLNDWNILTQGNQVTAFIDFGDIAYTPLIHELAIALTYMMLGKENPFEVILPVIKGYQSVIPLLREEVELLPMLITTRLCVSVCNSAEAKANAADTEYILISEKPAWELLRYWISCNPVAITNLFLQAAGLETSDYETQKTETAHKRSLYLGKSLGLSYQQPIHLHSAAFQYMYDTAGNTYLDAYNNIPHVGHCHPKVSEAISRQVRLLNTNTRYLYDSLADYAEKLLAYFPPSLNKIFFVNSGSMASDLAIRMAHTYTQRRHNLVLEMGYHGNTITGIDISSYKFDGKGGKGQPDCISVLPLPNLFNGLFQTTTEYVTHARQLLEQLEAEGKKVSAFIAEPISGCGGQMPLAPGYLKALYAELHRRGIVTISDEVQTGFGRLGHWFWGFQMHEVVPDMVVLGKPMGNGHPIAAVVTTTAIADAFANGMEFFSSFGGNPVSTEAAKAVLEVLEEEQLQTHAKDTGDYFMAQLQSLQKTYPVLGDVRGSGLFLGIEFVKVGTHEPDTTLAARIKNQLKDQFILTGTDGRYDNVLKIKPPMCFNRKNADLFCAMLAKLLL